MAPTIRVLDETLIDQIAAGEVIERPANLVKELVENAIDAKAAEITVSVEDGGRSRVRVSDDGIGMTEQDVRLAVQRHATSKITSFADLTRVSTLGFRGEALPSIGSVTRLTIVTRPRESRGGTRLVLEGGVLRDVEPAGCPPGTTVEADDLFYNVPARRKFLRARQTETSKILEVCQRLALAHPGVRLTVSSEGRTIRQYLPSKSVVERARQAFGGEHLYEILVERDGVAIEAALAPAARARLGARYLVLLVNGRPVTDRGLARAVAFGFGERLAPGHYPRGVVSLRIPPENVDVNAHPQKTEVRFQKANVLMERVARMISGRLASMLPGEEHWDARLGSVGPVAQEPGDRVSPSIPGVSEGRATYRSRHSNGLRFVARVNDRAIVCENGLELMVIDRFRADALARYDALREAADRGPIEGNALLFPDRLELEPADAARLERHAALLQSLGLGWTKLGESSYVVRALPGPVADAPAAPLLRHALGALAAEREQNDDVILTALAREAARSVAGSFDDAAADRLIARLRRPHESDRACVLGRIALPLDDQEDDRA